MYLSHFLKDGYIIIHVSLRILLYCFLKYFYLEMVYKHPRHPFPFVISFNRFQTSFLHTKEFPIEEF